MSKQQEDYKKLASGFRGKAEHETGAYRDVLLGIAEAYAALALHQGVFDDWPRIYPVTRLARSQPPVKQPAPGASQMLSKSAAASQANQNGKAARPSAVA